VLEAQGGNQYPAQQQRAPDHYVLHFPGGSVMVRVTKIFQQNQ